jgi:predicted nucleotide-binding protein
MTRTIDHPRWDASWAVPSEHTIDDLGELGLLRVVPSSSTSRTFTLTMKARELASELQVQAAGTPTSNQPQSGTAVIGDRGESTGADDRPSPRPQSSEAKDPRKVAVMHGRDGAARDAVFDLLRRLRLEPLEWDDLVDFTGNAAPYNGEAVAAAFKIAQAVVVLLTPDDVGFLHPRLRGNREREDDREPTGQPRLNVVLEAGMALQSHPQETVLVEIGQTRGISDLAGRNTVRLDGSPGPFNSLANRLQAAGCPVHRGGSDWLSPSNFASLEAITREAPPEGRRTSQDQVDAIRFARHVAVELATIDRTLRNALEDGYWWNLHVESLPSEEWASARDSFSHNAALYETVAAAYVDADQMNKAAYNHAQGGHDGYDSVIRERLEQARRSVEAAQSAIRDFTRHA